MRLADLFSYRKSIITRDATHAGTPKSDNVEPKTRELP